MKEIQILLILSLTLCAVSCFHIGIERNFDKLIQKRQSHAISKGLEINGKTKLPSKYEILVGGGDLDGLYYIQISLGTPPQTQYVQCIFLNF